MNSKSVFRLLKYNKQFEGTSGSTEVSPEECCWVREKQETEEKTGAVLDLQDDEQKGESSCDAVEFSKKNKTRVRTQGSGKSQLHIRDSLGGANRLERVDASGEKRAGKKQSFKRVLLLPLQMISVLAFGIGFCVMYLLFGGQEEESES
jgi:hypothetical protein